MKRTLTALIALVALAACASWAGAKEYRAPVELAVDRSVDTAAMRPGESALITLHMTAKRDIDYLSTYATGKGVRIEYLAGAKGFFSVAAGATVDTVLKVTLVEPPGSIEVEYTTDYLLGGSSRADFGNLPICCFGTGETAK